MYRPILTALLAVLIGCMPPNARQADADPFFGAEADGIIAVRVLNLDWDVKNFWVYCDGRQELVFRDLALSQRSLKRITADCRILTFKSEGQGGELLFRSPSLKVPTGSTLDIRLMESGRAQWRWGRRMTR